MANQTISCQHSTTEEVLSDIESLSYLAGWEKSECLQLHAGRLKTLCGQATVGLTRLLSVSPSVTLLDRGVYNGAETAISMIIGGESSPKYVGPIDRETTIIVWRKGQEDCHEYTIPKGAIDLTIMIPDALLEAMGWRLDERFIRVRSPQQINALINTCQTALGRSRRSADAHDTRIIAALDQVFAKAEDVRSRKVPAITMTQSYQILADAARLLESQASDRQSTISADDIAGQLGISRRSLFSHFRKWLGVGPHRYLHLVRLHRLRKRLLQASNEDTTITVESLSLGINHLGRLSSEYRELFGELPSETLRRVPI